MGKVFSAWVYWLVFALVGILLVYVVEHREVVAKYTLPQTQAPAQQGAPAPMEPPVGDATSGKDVSPAMPTVGPSPALEEPPSKDTPPMDKGVVTQEPNALAPDPAGNEPAEVPQPITEPLPENMQNQPPSGQKAEPVPVPSAPPIQENKKTPQPPAQVMPVEKGDLKRS